MKDASRTLSNVVRALRLPFLPVSVLPFIFGLLLVHGEFSHLRFLLGLVVVAATHLSATVINDYGDSVSGADWQDTAYYGLFGGSKLIQQGVFPARLYLMVAAGLAVTAIAAAAALAALTKNFLCIALYGAVLVMAWGYTLRPLRLSHRGLGEIAVFLAYGPAPVIAGYFVAAADFPPPLVLLLSLPFGFFTAGVLLANEVPDAPGDAAAGKRTLVVRAGATNGYVLYAATTAGGLAAVLAGVLAGRLSALSLLTLAAVVPALCAVLILRRSSGEKAKLIASSRLAIAAQAIVSAVLILDAATGGAIT